ncbi:MAG TPA: DUF4270 domain-containing protein [Sphingobacteriaceae bacterium]|nr:DUF4270 domain-containing protein [Sphingobacteriaceae bacterium]
MKYLHRDLLTLLISLFILASCTNPTGVGLEVTPENQIEAFFSDTVSIRAYTVRDDSVQSGSFDQTLFGQINDPIFGKTVVGLAVELSRPNQFVQFREDVEIDSVILVLPYGGNYYGDTTQASTFAVQVQPLAETFQVNTYSTKQWDVKPEVVGSKTLPRYGYKTTDSLWVKIRLDGKDTTVKAPPQMRVALSNDYFKNLLGASVDSATLSTAQGFKDHVKGLYLSIDQNASTGIGGLVTFAARQGVSGVEMTYRQSNGLTGDDAGIDTIRTLLEITPATFSSGFTFFLGMASSVQNNYPQAILDQLDAPVSGKEEIYLHAPTGLRGKIVFPNIDYLKGRNLSINKAELVLYVDQEKMEGPLAHPAPRLTLYRQDLAGQRQNIPDGAAISPSTGTYFDNRSLDFLNFGGWYEKEKQRYIFHLTSYIQDVLMGKINGNELYIAPISPTDTYVPTMPALNGSGRVILGGGNHPTYRMKLNLYYTEN